jgi:hypothetical protein
MDFSIGNRLGTDEISSVNHMNYNDHEIFVTEPYIRREMEYPKPQYKFPDPPMKSKVLIAPRRPVLTEGFYNPGPILSENNLIILLLVILVILCTMTYASVKQNAENIKLMAGILAAR